jgi:hypothetical protein
LELDVEKKPSITFGSQMGDVKAAEAVQPHLIELRNLLKKYCIGLYSNDIDEFAPIARVDGEIWHWNFEGCQRMRLIKKERYITIDIGVPRHRWENVSGQEIKRYLFNYLEEAIHLMINRLKSEKFTINEEDILKDLSAVKKEYL